jgi:parvulin-like peptidyl-prolyl isomerase
MTSPARGATPTRRFALPAAAASLVFLAALPAALPAAEPSPRVAGVGGTVITLEQLQDEVTRRERRTPGRIRSREDIRRVLEEMVLLEAMAAEATRRGIADDPEVRRAVRELLAASLERRQLGEALAAVAVSDAEVEERYRRRPEDFLLPESRQGAMIAIKLPPAASPERVQQIRERMEAARQEAIRAAEAAPHFGTVAYTYSEDQATRYRGGELGWLTRESAASFLPPAAVEALFGLEKPGTISAVVEVPPYLYLFRHMGQRGGDPAPLADVRERLRQRLLEEKRHGLRREFQLGVLKAQGAQIAPEVLEGVPLPASAPTAPPAGPVTPR